MLNLHVSGRFGAMHSQLLLVFSSICIYTWFKICFMVMLIRKTENSFLQVLIKTWKELNKLTYGVCNLFTWYHTLPLNFILHRVSKIHEGLQNKLFKLCYWNRPWMEKELKQFTSVFAELVHSPDASAQCFAFILFWTALFMFCNGPIPDWSFSLLKQCVSNMIDSMCSWIWPTRDSVASKFIWPYIIWCIVRGYIKDTDAE